MSYSVQNAKQDLTGIIHGTQLNKVTNLNQLFNRAARQVLQDLDPQETIRISQINPVFTGVWNYPVPDDLKGTKIIDIYPQVNRTTSEISLSRYNQAFDLTKTSLLNEFTIVYDTGTRYLRLNSPFLPVPIGINGASSITDNGTWTANDGAGNLSVDMVNFVFGGGALEFDITDVGLGSELITNGSFTGNANDWFVYDGSTNTGELAGGSLNGWTYSSNHVVHTAGGGFGDGLGQNLGLIPGVTYTVTMDVGGTAGTVGISMNGHVVGSGYTPGSSVDVDLIAGANGNSGFEGLFIIVPTSDFDGTIDNVTVKQLLSNDGRLTNSTQAAVDLSTLVNQGSLFLETYLPTASIFQNLVLQWGSSATDYYEVQVDDSQFGSFVDGWNLLQFDWVNATTIGSPNSTSITFLNVIWNTDGTEVTGVHLNNIWAALPSILNFEYYSQDLFQDVAGNFQPTVTDDSNLINLNIDSYNIFLNQLAYLVAQQTQGLDAEFFDANFFLTAYTQGVTRYKTMYKSQIQKPQTNYYILPAKGYTQFLGRRWY